MKKPEIVTHACGDSTKPLHGHHPDYARPLMVLWLCGSCHGQQTMEDYLERRMWHPRKHARKRSNLAK